MQNNLHLVLVWSLSLHFQLEGTQCTPILPHFYELLKPATTPAKLWEMYEVVLSLKSDLNFY